MLIKMLKTVCRNALSHVIVTCVMAQSGFAENCTGQFSFGCCHVGLSIPCILQGSVHLIQVSIPAVIYAAIRSSNLPVPPFADRVGLSLDSTKASGRTRFVVHLQRHNEQMTLRCFSLRQHSLRHHLTMGHKSRIDCVFSRNLSSSLSQVAIVHMRPLRTPA